MNEDVSTCRVGRAGGVLLPHFLLPSIDSAEQGCTRKVLQQGTEREGGCGVHGPCHLLPSQAPPKLDWVTPAELIRPLKPYKGVEEALRYYVGHCGDAFVPREVLQGLLQECGAPKEAHLTVAALGNRAAACAPGPATLLLAHPSGNIGELVTLSVLTHSPNSAPGQPAWRWAAAQEYPCADQAVLQLALNGQPASLEAGQPVPDDCPMLLAVRCCTWLCILSLHQAAPRPEGLLQWGLQPVAAVASKQRIMHLCWNRSIPSQAAFLCEDGSVHLLDCAPALTAPAVAGFQPLQSRCVVEAQLLMPYLEPGTRERWAVSCVFGAHPRTLLLAVGRRLLRCDIRRPGRPAAITLLHTRPEEGDHFHALAVPVQVSGGHLLAAATVRRILLFDARRPVHPLLLWAHPFDREPPRLLSLLCRMGPDPQQQQQQQQQKWSIQRVGEDAARLSNSLQGCITAAGLGGGDGVAFRFTLSDSSLMLAASAPRPEAEAAGKHSRRSALPKGFPGSIDLFTGDAAPPQAAEFWWRPHLGGAARSVDLPHRICRPLGGLHSSVPTALGRLHDVGTPLEPVLEAAPDLQGIAVAMLPAASGIDGCCDSVLVRVNFMGDVVVNDCHLLNQPPAIATQPGTTALHKLQLPIASEQQQQQQNDGTAAELPVMEALHVGPSPAPAPAPQVTIKDGISLTRKTAAGNFLVPLPAHYAAITAAIQHWAGQAGAGATGTAPPVAPSQEAILEVVGRMQVALTAWELHQVLRRFAAAQHSPAGLVQRAQGLLQGRPVGSVLGAPKAADRAADMPQTVDLLREAQAAASSVIMPNPPAPEQIAGLQEQLAALATMPEPVVHVTHRSSLPSAGPSLQQIPTQAVPAAGPSAASAAVPGKPVLVPADSRLGWATVVARAEERRGIFGEAVAPPSREPLLLCPFTSLDPDLPEEDTALLRRLQDSWLQKEGVSVEVPQAGPAASAAASTATPSAAVAGAVRRGAGAGGGGGAAGRSQAQVPAASAVLGATVAPGRAARKVKKRRTTAPAAEGF